MVGLRDLNTASPVLPMPEDVLVLGGGFGGLNAALRIAGNGHDVTLLDRKSFHEFTPGLIDIYRGRVPEEKLKLEFSDFLDGTGVEFSREEIDGIYPGNQVVETHTGRHEYDQLVVALGSEPRTHGVDIREAYAPYTLSSVKEAVEDLEDSESVAVVGGGYVGVEIATEIALLGKDVTVLEEATRPLPGSGQKASHLALDHMNEVGIDFRGGKEVSEVGENGVRTGKGQRIGAETVLWAAGVQAPSTVRDSFDCGPKGIDVNSGLSSKEYSNVFALGDCADFGSEKTARNAMRQGGVVASNIERDKNQELEQYSNPTFPMVISLGNTGIFQYRGFTVRNRAFRHLRDLIRMRYMYMIRKLGWKIRVL